MVLVKEFRIVMPFRMDEYRRGNRYSVARLNKEVTTAEEGIELLESREYTDETYNVPGRYTKKVYHLESRVPGWVKMLAPASALKLDEESWDAWPHCKTVITNRFFGERFSLTIESHHVDKDKGEQENVLNLSEEALKNRKVVKWDIAKDQLNDTKEYKEDEDPRIFQSKNFADKFQPLTEGWQDRAENYMCCYKTVTILFKVWGVQGRGESWMMDFEGQIFLKFHKEIFCWLDDWYGMSMEEILASEKKFIAAMGDTLSVPDGDASAAPSEGEKKKDKKDKKTTDAAPEKSSSPEPADVEEAAPEKPKKKKKKAAAAEGGDDVTSGNGAATSAGTV